jgi:WYL_2, Sm-like SH3 beta-barrel fold
METIATTTAIHYKKLIEQTNGKIFVVEFTKKNGEPRRLVGRLGVRCRAHGGKLNFDPNGLGLVNVYDIQNHGYRFINLETVHYFRCGSSEAGNQTPEVPR